MTNEESDSTDTGRNSVPVNSPLIEHYDAFRSLCIIHKALLDDGLDELEDSDPFRQWVRDVRSMIDEDGFGEQPTGYGGQLKNTDRVSISEYRERKGDGTRLTEFDAIDVIHPPLAVLELLDDRMSDLDTWHVPISPDSETPLPVLVETQTELERAETLLTEFPLSPPVLDSSANEATDECGSSESTASTPTNEQSDSDSTNTKTNVSEDDSSASPENADTERTEVPVKDVRGVPSSAVDALVEAGYETRADLRAASDQELAAIDGLTQQRVTLIRATVGSE